MTLALTNSGRPLTNILVDPAWRHEILPVLVRRTTMRALATG
jgi:hypothetical protein